MARVKSFPVGMWLVVLCVTCDCAVCNRVTGRHVVTVASPQPFYHSTLIVHTIASKSSIRRFVITEKAPTRAFSLVKAATIAFTFKTLLRH